MRNHEWHKWALMVDTMWDRFGSDAPPLETRHFTRFSPRQPFDATDVPSYPGVPLRLVMRFLRVQVGALLRR